MITPYLADDAFLADVAHAAQPEPDNLHIWWLGQSGYLVCYQNTRFIFDPYLSDSLTRKYADTDKPHTRMTERVIAPERLTGISFVTSTHNHTDHLDAETLLPIFATNPNVKLVLGLANIDFAANRLGEAHRERFVGLVGDGDSVWVDNMQITGLVAAHEAIETDAKGNYKYLGFIVTIGPFTLYHSGDTVLYDGLSDTLGAANIDIAFLPINGRAPERRVSGNLWGREAAQLGKNSGIKTVIPCHYEMFEFNTATMDEFITTCEGLGQGYKILRAGERATFAPSTA
jgi:L-ascorbate metabolism protein UlaG (beta-lactamase superfamily)